MSNVAQIHTKRPWYAIEARTGKTATEIQIHDEIGSGGVTAKHFIDSLKFAQGDITLSINSPGGSVVDALAIYNALRMRSGKTTVRVMGVAASAASLIAMAGDVIAMPENTFMMIHHPMVGTHGNASELREQAELLDKVGKTLAGIYEKRTKQPASKIAALLEAETWMTAQEAKALGFCDVVEDELKLAARASYNTKRLPAQVRAALQKSSAGGARVTTASIWAARQST